MSYVLSIDQSTSGTKALLFNSNGRLVDRCDLAHEQKISGLGWVSHDPMEIWKNTVQVVKELLSMSAIEAVEIEALGISNQRETALIWDRETGLPVADAVVWQCSRGAEICERLADSAEKVRKKTGLNLSPYFPAAKWAWILENTPELQGKSLCAGTIDSWLIFKLTGGGSFKTDYSNASRTQLFNISTLKWDEELCSLFQIDISALPQVCFSDSCFGYTDIGGALPKAIPIYGVLGDSHGALFGQGCLTPGMSKATYGTGSSVMMNVGDKPVFSSKGVVTSLAWGMKGKVEYVLEGNINYTGAVTKWIVEGLKLIESSKDAGKAAAAADPEDGTYLVPAFTGLGAPYWNSQVRAAFIGMSRTTGRDELVKAAEECIAYQITDVIKAMSAEAGVQISELRVDGGPTRDRYLMQFQSDILDITVAVPEKEELSGIGAAYCAGIAAGIYDVTVLENMWRTYFKPAKNDSWREKRYGGWIRAVETLLSASD